MPPLSDYIAERRKRNDDAIAANHDRKASVVLGQPTNSNDSSPPLSPDELNAIAKYILELMHTAARSWLQIKIMVILTLVGVILLLIR